PLLLVVAHPRHALAVGREDDGAVGALFPATCLLAGRDVPQRHAVASRDRQQFAIGRQGDALLRSLAERGGGSLLAGGGVEDADHLRTATVNQGAGAPVGRDTERFGSLLQAPRSASLAGGAVPDMDAGRGSVRVRTEE